MSYDSMRIALAAIQKANKADRAAVIEALRGTKFDGLSGQWSFDENGDTRLMLVTGVSQGWQVDINRAAADALTHRGLRLDGSESW